MNNLKLRNILRTVFSLLTVTILLVGSLPSGKVSASGSRQESTPEPSAPDSGARPVLPAFAPDLVSSSAPGYCSSGGGSTAYEFINSVKLTPNPGGTMLLEVQVYIANPTGCTVGEPCPEYDNSPENVNVWVDWNGDKQWAESERIMDAALTGYFSINYRGTMTAITQFTPPDPSTITTAPTWLRANLGWSSDPNDPCTPSWEWGNVVDQEVHVAGPQILSITAKGVSTPGELPTTGKAVHLEAALSVPPDYQVTGCSWTGDLTAGSGNPASNCSYDYTPATGSGPAINTYGPKNISLTLNFVHTPTSSTGQTSKDHSYKVFFNKGTAASWGDDNGDGIPNWFEYWKDDWAVTQLNVTDVFYDQTLGNSTYGYWSPVDDNIHVGGAAAMTHYPSNIVVPAVASTCPGGTFGGAKGIDSLAEVLVHERRHEQIAHGWNAGGAWVGLADSDKGVPTAAHNDSLPDTYETGSGTRNDNVDSCALATHKSPTYNTYGDNEFDAIRTSNNSNGVAANDWANPGKATTPPFGPEPSAYELIDAPNFKSGALSSTPSIGTAYSGALHPAAVLVGSLTGAYTDAGVDSDVDGSFDQLKISVGVQADMAELYNVVGWLEDASGTPVAFANTQQQLTAGAHTVDLLFDGFIIRESGLDGPYTLARVELRAGDEEGVVDAADDAHTTGAYAALDFDPRDAAFSGVYSNTGIDTGSDGMFDILQVSVGLDVDTAGTYTVTGELEGTGPIAVAVTTAALTPGSHTVDLEFDGRRIFQHRQSGSYELRSLRVVDAAGEMIHFVSDAYTTTSYTYLQFQHGLTLFDETSVAEVALDVDADGDYDYLRVTLDVYAEQAGLYRISAGLKDITSTAIAQVFLVTELVTGTNSLTLDIPGAKITQHGVDGPYQLASLTLIDSIGNILDVLENAITTTAYLAASFTEPLVALSGGFADEGLDSNGNSLYEALVISFNVTPGDAGIIVAQGRLVDGAGSEIQWTENFVEMTAGTPQEITLVFNGAMIIQHGQNGPYTLKDLVIYHTGDPEQSIKVEIAHTTGAYDIAMFEQAATGPIYLPLIRK